MNRHDNQAPPSGRPQGKRIGDVARETGIAAHVLRHWEDEGILKPARDSLGHRRYRPEDLSRATAVRRAQEAGFTLEQIRRFIRATAQERKDISIEILKSQGVPFIDHLPLRYETGEVAPREKDEVIARAICSFAAIMCACTIRDNGELTDEDKQGTKDFLDNRFGCLDKLTRMERRVIEGEASYDEAVNMGWK